MPYFSEADARSIIRETYGQVQSDGAAVAEALYAPEELARLPRGAVELALGVAHPVRHAGLKPGQVVLDLGCGGGIDTLLAAMAVGPQGKAIGLDMTPKMLERAQKHTALMGLTNVELREGMMEEIPLSDASVDVIISNGVLNLSTRKSRALAEMIRVLRPGGRVSISDLVLTETLPEPVLKSPAALAG
ncbi:MAG: methyltransferase domain-containing protein [Candidatus Tectomicrobia bacterium]|uniref:Arsenite methyltransferase n=1 Tax=Tectimicrobiota bacterium TaxID=2528274 RepID=A0A932GSV2_UNCTE|nr:methyltransferase domain-containing protein [Candidatus Tectomicrobia bacterium]